MESGASRPGPAVREHSTSRDARVIHFLHSLEVGGLERVVLDLASRARADGLDHRLLVCDRPFEAGGRDFDPDPIPCTFLHRRPGFDVRFVGALRRFLVASRADVVHAHNDTPIAYAALAGIGGRGRPPVLVGTFHTLPSHGGRAARRLTRWASSRATAMTSVSTELGERLREDGWTGRLRTIRNGIDLEAYRPRACSNRTSAFETPGA